MPVFDETLDEKIIQEAKKEFLEKGFNDASTNSICKKVGCTTGALFKRYKSKEDLYNFIVNPTKDKIFSWYENETKSFFNKSKDEQKRKTQEGYEKTFIDLLYEDFDIYKIIICKSSREKTEEFIDFFIEKEISSLKMYISYMYPKSKNKLSNELYHVLGNSYFNGIFEVVRHSMSKEKALDYSKALMTIFKTGVASYLKG